MVLPSSMDGRTYYKIMEGLNEEEHTKNIYGIITGSCLNLKRLYPK